MTTAFDGVNVAGQFHQYPNMSISMTEGMQYDNLSFYISE